MSELSQPVPPALGVSEPRSAHRARMMNVAVIIAGLCTFLQVYVTQPLLPAFRRIFAASELKVSMTVSAVTIGVAIAAPIVGLLADVIGRKRVIVPAIFAIAVPTLLSATATSLNQLIFWRFLQGLCIPGIIAVIMAYIAEEADPGTAGTITANYVTGTVVGGLAGRLVAGFCADHVGWKTAFIILGITTILSGLLVWKWLPSSRHFTRTALSRST